MSAKPSKNDISWETLFKQENILDRIHQDGFFEISSSTINQQREARLMTKFDHEVQLPQIFRDNHLTIQPTSRGGYIIGAFQSYFKLPKKLSSEIIYHRLPFDLETLDTPDRDRKVIPFPQADSFPRIVDLLGRLYHANESLSKEEITLIYAFNERQTHYYVSAAIYLGLVNSLNAIATIMKQELDYSTNTLERRAQTVKSWIEWIFQLTRN